MSGSGEVAPCIGGQGDRGGVFRRIPQGQHGVCRGGGDQGRPRHGRGACGSPREGVPQLLTVQGEHQLSRLGDACLEQDQIGSRRRQQEGGAVRSADIRVGDDAVAGEGHVLPGEDGCGVIVGHQGVEIGVGEGGSRCPCGSLRTLRTHRTLRACGALGTCSACGTLGSGGTNGTLGTGCPLRACGTCFPLGTLGACFACGTCRAGLTHGTLRADRTLGTYGTRFPRLPSGTCGAHLTLGTLGPDGAGRADHAGTAVTSAITAGASAGVGIIPPASASGAGVLSVLVVLVALHAHEKSLLEIVVGHR